MVLQKFISIDHFIVAVPLKRCYRLFILWHLEFWLVLVLLVQNRPVSLESFLLVVKLNVPSVFNFKNCRPWLRQTLTPANLDSGEPWLRRTLTPDNRVVSVGWKISSWSSWTRLGSNGFGFSSFSSSVAAPSLVLNVDFNTCEWNELYYNYIRRLRYR